jgi:peptide/nickel transport system permease protein
VTRYIALRLGQIVPVLVLVSISVWLILYLIPGDPAAVVLGPDATPDQIASMRTRMGLDQPLALQYIQWLGRVLHGDLGESYLNGMPVRDLLAQRIPVTAHLALSAIIVALGVGIPLGLLSAARHGTWIGRVISGYAMLALSVPTFWLAILVVLLFAVDLAWLPSSGFVPIWEDPLRSLRFTILPAFSLGAYVSAVLIRFTRASLLETLSEDYVRTARAKGLTERTVLWRHALKNALIPVVTVIGLQFGAFMGGAVLTEAIFNYPGVGRLLFQAIVQRDYTVVQGAVLFIASAFVLVNLAADVAYAFLDPRIRFGGS